MWHKTLSWQELSCLYIVKETLLVFTWPSSEINQHTVCVCCYSFLKIFLQFSSVQFSSVQFSSPSRSFESNKLCFSDMRISPLIHWTEPALHLLVFVSTLEFRITYIWNHSIASCDRCVRAGNESVPEGAGSEQKGTEQTWNTFTALSYVNIGLHREQRLLLIITWVEYESYVSQRRIMFINSALAVPLCVLCCYLGRYCLKCSSKLFLTKWRSLVVYGYQQFTALPPDFVSVLCSDTPHTHTHTSHYRRTS